MVFFVCGRCNETIKKNKVDNHCTFKCSTAEFVSCVDCGVEFYGNDYAKHTSCITEAEKYGGKDYQANQPKGAVKQQQWHEQLNAKLSSIKTEDHRLQEMFDMLRSADNVPHKKVKLINFLKTKFPRYHWLYEEVWSVIDSVNLEHREHREQRESEAAKKPATSIEDKTETVMKKKKRKTAEGASGEVKKTKKACVDNSSGENLPGAVSPSADSSADASSKDIFSYKQFIRQAVVGNDGGLSLNMLYKKLVKQLKRGDYKSEKDIDKVKLMRRLKRKLSSMSDEVQLLDADGNDVTMETVTKPSAVIICLASRHDS